VDTTQNQLNGNVNHVTLLVVNVPVHPTENVLLVALLLPLLIYITDIVLLHVHQVIPNLNLEFVSHVTINVVNVTESLKILVPSVVITLSYITMNVSSHVHTVLMKTTIP
jgi:hypothetical protein